MKGRWLIADGPWILVILLIILVVQRCCGDEYEGWIGRWENVVATAYTAADPIDAAYHATKGARWRYITANGRTDVRRVPYGVAVPLEDGRPRWAFGTRLIIPTGLGYLDRLRADDREFLVDDVGNGHEYFATEHGKLHIDLRFVDRDDAIRWAGRTGKRTIRIFICSQRAPPPPLPVPDSPQPPLSVPVVPSTPDNVVGLPPAPEPEPEVLEAQSPPQTGWTLSGALLLLAITMTRRRRRASWEPIP